MLSVKLDRSLGYVGGHINMLGFAVIDDNPETGALAVWLTSRLGASRVGHSNAVIFKRADRDQDLPRIAGMVADRYLVLTDRTQADVAELTGLQGNAVELREMGRETLAVQQDLEAQLRAAKKPTGSLRWPIVPQEITALPDQSLDSAIALQTANHVAAVWGAWLATDAERVARVKILAPSEPEIRLVPPEFEAANAPMPMPMPMPMPSAVR